MIEVAVATPSVGVTSVGEVANTLLPVPVAPVAVTPPMEILVPKVCKAVQVLAVPSAVAFSPLAVMVPVPVVPKLPPVPTSIAAVVLVPAVMLENAVEPPVPHATPLT